MCTWISVPLQQGMDFALSNRGKKLELVMSPFLILSSEWLLSYAFISSVGSEVIGGAKKFGDGVEFAYDATIGTTIGKLGDACRNVIR